jgi:hypothetical protein
MMEVVTKPKPQRRRCQWCRKPLKSKPRGRPQLFCGPSCRQRAYEKRKWTPYTALDALSRDLLPASAMRRLVQEIRHKHMIELIKTGVVPLRDPAQIDGVLDGEKPKDRLNRLNNIESTCQINGNEEALATIARWRLERQSGRR